MGMADGATGWDETILLSGNDPETIRKPTLAGLGWQGWSGLGPGWAGLLMKKKRTNKTMQCGNQINTNVLI